MKSLITRLLVPIVTAICLILGIASCVALPPDQAALEQEVALAEDLAQAKATEAALLQTLAAMTRQPTVTPTPTATSTPALTHTLTPTITPSPTPTATPMPTPTPVDLQAIIAQGDEAMNQLRTLRFYMQETVRAEEGGLALTLTIDGVAESPDRAYMTVRALGESVEVLVLGDQVYQRQSGSQEWEPVPESERASDYVSEERLASLRLSDLVMDLERLPDEAIDGVDCYHIGLGLDVPKYFATVMTDEAARLLGEVEGTGHGELWQSQADNLRHKLVLEMDVTAAGEKLSLNLEVLASDFNQPVDIPQP
jgi:hypothetical protein